VRHEPDGDTCGWVKLDPGYESLLNAGNMRIMSDEDGNLGFEVVCKFRVCQLDDRTPNQAAWGTSLRSGSHVRITGSHVQDTNHAKWMEIHPVSDITAIPESPLREMLNGKDRQLNELTFSYEDTRSLVVSIMTAHANATARRR
jgi:hypothetical protein